MERVGPRRAGWLKTELSPVAGATRSSQLDLNHCSESTYLGHLVYVEQPGKLQAQHLEAGLARPGVAAALCHQASLKVLTWPGEPLASGCPGCFPERGPREETQLVSAELQLDQDGQIVYGTYLACDGKIVRLS